MNMSVAMLSCRALWRQLECVVSHTSEHVIVADVIWRFKCSSDAIKWRKEVLWISC